MASSPRDKATLLVRQYLDTHENVTASQVGNYLWVYSPDLSLVESNKLAISILEEMKNAKLVVNHLASSQKTIFLWNKINASVSEPSLNIVEFVLGIVTLYLVIRFLLFVCKSICSLYYSIFLELFHTFISICQWFVTKIAVLLSLLPKLHITSITQQHANDDKLDLEEVYPNLTLVKNTALFSGNFSKWRRQYCDITVHLPNRDYPAHKMLLGHVSPVFFAMYFGSGRHMIQQNKLKLDDDQPECVERFLDCIYATNQIETLFSPSNGDYLEYLLDMLLFTDKYQIDGMRRMLILQFDFLVNRLDRFSLPKHNLQGTVTRALSLLPSTDDAYTGLLFSLCKSITDDIPSSLFSSGDIELTEYIALLLERYQDVPDNEDGKYRWQEMINTGIKRLFDINPRTLFNVRLTTSSSSPHENND